MKKLLFLILLFQLQCIAQVQFVASVSKNSLGINERLRIDFITNEDGDNFKPPLFEGFRIVGKPINSATYTCVNGNKSMEYSHSYFLDPIKKGVYIINSATIEIKRKIYKTIPVKITVGKNVPLERKREIDNPFFAFDEKPLPVLEENDGVFIVSENLNKSPFLYEPITLCYKIYVSKNSGLKGSKIIKSPLYYFDFITAKIENGKKDILESIFKDELCRYSVLYKVVLYPIKTGEIKIDPLVLDLDVGKLTLDENNFKSISKVNYVHKKASTDTIAINVKPLPELDKPENFSDAVGDFSLKVIPSKTKLNKGEKVILKLQVCGKGNLGEFNLPTLSITPIFNTKTPVYTENIKTSLSGFEGSIQDEYELEPRESGEFLIEPIVFSYFDLNTKTYKSIKSEAITLEVLENNSKFSNAKVGEKK